jgi:hypothetical protein
MRTTYPTFVSGFAVHKIDQSSEKTSESSSGGSSREEKSDSEVDLVPPVPLGQEEGDTGELKSALATLSYSATGEIVDSPDRPQ